MWTFPLPSNRAGVGASESSWEVAAATTKSNPAFQVQRSRSALKLKISDKARGERKSIWPIQLAALPGSGSASASKLRGELQPLHSQCLSRKLCNLQMEETEKGTTGESQPKCHPRHREMVHTCANQNKNLLKSGHIKYYHIASVWILPRQSPPLPKG